MTVSAGDYAFIGDTRTGALVSKEGSIDWLCLPTFDGDPVFGRLIDPEGGSFSVGVEHGRVTGRRYRERSAIVETTWRSPDGEALVTDGMILDVSSRLLPQALLVRTVRCTRGSIRVRVVFDPRKGIPARRPRVVRSSSHGLLCSWGAMAVGVSASVPLRPGEESIAELGAGSSLGLCMSLADRQPMVWVSPERAAERMDETDRWWRDWCEKTTYDGPHGEVIRRSLITLRLLTYTPSGAPVAAPTTSLPAPPGSDRAWDYRFSWPRDASVGVEAFLALHHPENARAFMRWLQLATRTTRPRMHPLYTLYGRPAGAEHVIRPPGRPEPIRIGNAAARQRQLDVYGWVNDAARILESEGDSLDRGEWSATASFADFAARHWREPDQGIWEVRSAPQHHVHSKLMAWTAIDRAIHLADRHRVRASRLERWRSQREALAEDIRRRGVDEARGIYTGRYGSADLDAALLMLPGLGFDDPRSPIVDATVSAIRSELSAGDPLLYRYRPGYDGLEGGEAAFVACSFWLVQALAITGRIDDAHEAFDRMISMASPAGLFAEQIDPQTHRAVGNYPQALSHAALLQAAAALAGVSVGEGKRPESHRTRRARKERRPASRVRS